MVAVLSCVARNLICSKDDAYCGRIATALPEPLRRFSSSVREHHQPVGSRLEGLPSRRGTPTVTKSFHHTSEVSAKGFNLTPLFEIRSGSHVQVPIDLSSHDWRHACTHSTPNIMRSYLLSHAQIRSLFKHAAVENAISACGRARFATHCQFVLAMS